MQNLVVTRPPHRIPDSDLAKAAIAAASATPDDSKVGPLAEPTTTTSKRPRLSEMFDSPRHTPVAEPAEQSLDEQPQDGGGVPARGSSDDPIDNTSSSMVDKGRAAWHSEGRGPVPTANGPVRHRWRKIAGRTASKAWGDSLFGLSSQAAFWCALSTAPLLLALLGLVGPVADLFGPNTINEIQGQVDKFLNSIFNQEVANNLVGDTVSTILQSRSGGFISVGLVISLWAGSSAMSAFVESITIAYGQHEVRHPVKERFFALGLYLIALFSGILLLPLLAIGPAYLPRLFPKDWRDNVESIVNYAYYPVIAVSLILLLTTLYKVAPKHKHSWKRGIPGALLAAAVFIVASFGLRLYLSYVYANGLTYGALATPITFLLFYYFASMAIVIGAQFNNASLEYYPPRLSKSLRKQAAKETAAVTPSLSPPRE